MAKKKTEKKAKPLIEVYLGEHVVLPSFPDIAALKEWITAEAQAWMWMADVEPRPKTFLLVWNPVNEGHSSIIAQVNMASASDPSKEQIKSITTVLKQVFIKNRVILSTSPAGRFIARLEDTDDRAALAATAYLMKRPLDTDRNTLRGAIEAALFEKGLGGALEAEREALETLLHEMQQQHSASKAEQDELTTSIRGLRGEIGQEVARHSENHDVLIRSHQTTFSEVVETGKEELKKITKTYDSLLAVEKPVDYWSKKQTAHLIAAICFSVAFVLGVAAVMRYLVPYLSDHVFAVVTTKEGSTNEAWPWGRIGVGILLVTLSLWVLSILARFLLSNVHLLTDAHERKTLILTYLAMQRHGDGFKDPEKALILQIIFRPTATGIVKDDARPPVIFEKIIPKQL